MLDFNKENHVKNLPDIYKQNPDSNNFKILEVERVACNDLREGLRSIETILDLNNAYGKTLDLYGERVGQPRGLATDSKYILLIKSRMMRNIANGSYESIVNSICATFSCDPSRVHIIENEAACTVTIADMPLDTIVAAELTVSQTVAILQSLMPAGITIDSFLFDGTFEFSDSEDEYNENAGFSDFEGGEIGGTLGIVAGTVNDEVLPI